MYNFGFANPPLHNWCGESGKWYPHSVYPIGSIPDFASANYIFAKLRPDGLYDPLYIGESGEFDMRISNHEKLLPAIMFGATHVHVHLLAVSKSERLRIETDLRRAHWTPLNLQSDATVPLNMFMRSR